MSDLSVSVDDFNEKGFVILDTESFDISVREMSYNVVKFIKDCAFHSLPSSDHDNLGDYITDIHKIETENQITSKIYSFLPSVPDLYRFATQDCLIDNIKMLGLHSPALGTVPLVRIDRPKEEKFLTPWHQDYWYSYASLDSVVVWIPLGPLTKEHGKLNVAINTHKNGEVKYREFVEGNEPYVADLDIKQEQTLEVEVNFGEILIFKQSLLHKSGYNQSDSCRVSMQLRFNEMYKQEFPFSSFVAKHSDYVKDRQIKSLSK